MTQGLCDNPDAPGVRHPAVCLTISPMVRSPEGSTSRAMRNASDVARSALAGVTARMIAFSPCSNILCCNLCWRGGPANFPGMTSVAQAAWPAQASRWLASTPLSLAPPSQMCCCTRVHNSCAADPHLDVLPGHVLQLLHNRCRLPINGDLGQTCIDMPAEPR
jgi:hypothetical protein